MKNGSPINPILIIDGHLDMAYNALFHRRDLTQSVRELRDREGGVRGSLSGHPDSLEKHRRTDIPNPGIATVTLPEMRKGRVGIMVSSIMCRVQAPGPRSHNAVRTQSAAWAVGQSHLAYYEALERSGEIFWIRNTRDLDTCIASWENPAPDTPVGLILSMESGDPIRGPEDVAAWWGAGLRSVSLTHFGANTWGHGTGTEGGLYACAYPLMDALADTGMILDVTHASDMAFWEIMDYWDGPVHASHCHCRALVPGQRHLSDEMIKAVVERGGVIGLVFHEKMINPACNWDDPATYPKTATKAMSAVFRHLDYICQLAGDCDHVALGTDLDGGFGRETAPIDLDTIADLQEFLNIIRRHGYSETDVEKIAHRNLITLFRNAWNTWEADND
jgi:membrane dipeptidase